MSTVGAVGQPAHISRVVPVCAPYADNANVIALRRSAGARLHRMVIQELDNMGLEWHDEHVAEVVFEFLAHRRP